VMHSAAASATCTAMPRSEPQWFGSIPVVCKASTTFPQCTATHHNSPQHTAMVQKRFAMFLQCTAMHRNALQCSASTSQCLGYVMHHNTLQRTTVCLSVRIRHPGWVDRDAVGDGGWGGALYWRIRFWW